MTKEVRVLKRFKRFIGVLAVLAVPVGIAASESVAQPVAKVAKQHKTGFSSCVGPASASAFAYFGQFPAAQITLQGCTNTKALKFTRRYPGQSPIGEIYDASVGPTHHILFSDSGGTSPYFQCVTSGCSYAGQTMIVQNATGTISQGSAYVVSNPSFYHGTRWLAFTVCIQQQAYDTGVWQNGQCYGFFYGNPQPVTVP